MIVYSGTKSQFHSDGMFNDIVDTFEYANMGIPNAEGEELIVIAEVIGKCTLCVSNQDTI